MTGDDDHCGYRRPPPGEISFDEAHARYPEALALFDTATRIAEADDVQFYVVKKNSRFHARSSKGRAYWDAGVGVWVLFTCGVSSRPRRPCRTLPAAYAPDPLWHPPMRTCGFRADGCGDNNCVFCYEGAASSQHRANDVELPW